MFKISQRRYLGNKNSILPFIDNIIKNEIGHFNSFCDIFFGTGTVGHYDAYIKKDLQDLSFEIKDSIICRLEIYLYDYFARDNLYE